MRVLRTTDRPEQGYSLTFMGYAEETESAVLELTFNYGTAKYDLGTAYGHVAIGCDDIAAVCEKVVAAGGSISRPRGPVLGGSTIIAFVVDPDGYKVELIEGNNT